MDTDTFDLEFEPEVLTIKEFSKIIKRDKSKGKIISVADLKKELPGSVRLEVFHDKSEQIVESIDDVKTTIYIAIALVVLVIFFFILV